MRATAFSIESFVSWWETNRPTATFLPFQNPAVMRIWENTIGLAGEKQCYAVRLDDDHGKPVLAVFLSLKASTRMGLKTLSFMDDHVIDYNAPIIFQPTILLNRSPRDVWSCVRSALPSHDFLYLRKIPPLVKGHPNPLWDPLLQKHFSSGHVTTLPREWSLIEQEKSDHKLLKSVKRNLRLLGDHGPVEFQLASGFNRQDVFNTLISQKKERLAQIGQDQLFRQTGIEEFYRACATQLDERLAHLSAIRVGSEIVATNFGFVDDESFYGVLMAFAQGKWARYSCGNILLQWSLRWAIENGLRKFDFGVGDEEYKMFWCDQNIELASQYGAVSFAGHSYSLMSETRDRIKKLFSTAPPLN